MNVLKKTCKCVFGKIFHRVKYIGKENIDYSRSQIFAANHTNWMDPIFIVTETDNIAIMAKKELFKIKWFGNILEKNGAFPIDRDNHDFKNLFKAINILRDKNNPRTLFIFPEGTRKAAKKQVEAKKGTVYIAAVTKVPVIPIYISDDRRPFSTVIVSYGKPYYINIDKNDMKNKEVLDMHTKELMDKIYEMKIPRKDIKARYNEIVKKEKDEKTKEK